MPAFRDFRRQTAFVKSSAPVRRRPYRRSDRFAILIEQLMHTAIRSAGYRGSARLRSTPGAAISATLGAHALVKSLAHRLALTVGMIHRGRERVPLLDFYQPIISFGGQQHKLAVAALISTSERKGATQVSSVASATVMAIYDGNGDPEPAKLQLPADSPAAAKRHLTSRCASPPPLRQLHGRARVWLIFTSLINGLPKHPRTHRGARAEASHSLCPRAAYD
jgi:hypothetical protein